MSRLLLHRIIIIIYIDKQEKQMSSFGMSTLILDYLWFVYIPLDMLTLCRLAVQCHDIVRSRVSSGHGGEGSPKNTCIHAHNDM